MVSEKRFFRSKPHHPHINTRFLGLWGKIKVKNEIQKLMGVKIDKLVKDAELFFAKYDAMPKIKGIVSEAEAMQILSCSKSTLNKWRKRLGVRQFVTKSEPSYFKKDIEYIKIHRQFSTLIKKLRKL